MRSCEDSTKDYVLYKSLENLVLYVITRQLLNRPFYNKVLNVLNEIFFPSYIVELIIDHSENNRYASGAPFIQMLNRGNGTPFIYIRSDVLFSIS